MTQQMCLYCEKDSLQVPLLVIQYQDKELWICPQHLPILIHKPAQLAHKLPGMESIDPPEGHAHD